MCHNDCDQCLNCQGAGGVEPAQLFSQPPNILSNYVLGGQLYTIYIGFTSYRMSTTPGTLGNTGNLLEFYWCSWKTSITCGLRQSKSSTPQLIFHNSNTDCDHEHQILTAPPSQSAPIPEPTFTVHKHRHTGTNRVRQLQIHNTASRKHKNRN